jgi:hypothetical protein
LRIVQPFLAGAGTAAGSATTGAGGRESTVFSIVTTFR